MANKKKSVLKKLNEIAVPKSHAFIIKALQKKIIKLNYLAESEILLEHKIKKIIISNNTKYYWLTNFRYLIQYSLFMLFSKWGLLENSIYINYFKNPKKIVDKNIFNNTAIPPRIAVRNSFEYKIALQYKNLFARYNRKLNTCKNKINTQDTKETKRTPRIIGRIMGTAEAGPSTVSKWQQLTG